VVVELRAEVEVVEVVEVVGAEVDVVEVVVEQGLGVAVDVVEVVVVVVVESGTVLATGVCCCFWRKSAKPSLKVFTFSSCSATHTTTDK
jgi:hypothetical protein